MTESLAEMYRRHRKTLNENLGLVIALAACGAAMWTGYEARHSRLEAASVAKDSLDAQHKAVEAQIIATRLDERPYIRVATVGIKTADEADRDTYDYRAVFTLVAGGRTPAIFVRWNGRCSLMQANQLTGTALTEKEALAKDTSNENLLILGESDLTMTTIGEGVLNSGESIQADCPFSKKDFRAGKDDVDIDPDKKITNDNSTVMTFLVDVAYSDVFDTKHKTQQCFYIPNGASPMREKLLSCQKFKPLIE